MTLCLSPVASGDQRSAFDVRFGSKADIEACIRDVRFTPESGHGAKRLSAIACVSGRYITAYAHITAPSGSF